MRTATCTLRGVSPYGQSAPIASTKDRDQTHKEFEEQHWKERGHYDQDDIAYIPHSAFRNCLMDAAQYKSIQIPGKGKATYTKHFKSILVVGDPISLGVSKNDVDGTWLYLPSDGKTGGSTRVWKCFPTFKKWIGKVQFVVLDDIVTNDVFEQHLIDAGQFIGVGFYRPQRRGDWGRFAVDDVTWSNGSA